VRIISHKGVVEFAAKHPNSASALDDWYRTMKVGLFHNLAELKAAFPSVDLIKKNLFVFNIGGNTARLVAIVKFTSYTVYILAILTHAEYDKDKWK
jgi:mRNA interferase HigB